MSQYVRPQWVAAVQHQAAVDQRYYTNYRTAVETQNKSWLYALVKVAVGLVVDSVTGGFVSLGIEAVWDFFSDLFDW